MLIREREEDGIETAFLPFEDIRRYRGRRGFRRRHHRDVIERR
jgi:hypothetical protein